MTRIFFRLCVALTLVTLLAAPDIQAGDPGCVEGALPQGIHQYGPAPGGAYELLGCVRIVNDRPYAREEIAYASVPIAAGVNLTDITGLALVGTGNVWVAGQFDVISRWGATMDDTAARVRWLQVSTPVSAGADDATAYELRQYAALVPPNDANAVTAAPAGSFLEINTGAARYLLDPDNPALFESIAVSLPGSNELIEVYRHSLGAGPQLVFSGDSGRVSVGETDTVFVSGFGDVTETAEPQGRVVVNADSFEVVESGPVKAVVSLRGNFLANDGQSLCEIPNVTAYERFAFTVQATFNRGSRDIVLEFHFANECSDAFSGPWTDEFAQLERVRWHMPFLESSSGVAAVADTRVLDAGAGGNVAVEQARGGGAPPDWRRRAEATSNGLLEVEQESFDVAAVALQTPTVTVSATLPHLRYREPQRLAVSANTIDFDFVSQNLILGEGKGIWNQVVLELEPTVSLDSNLPQYLSSRAQPLRDKAERGLLVSFRTDEVNRARIMPTLGSGSSSVLAINYESWMNMLHDQTVAPGGQWERNKTYGSQLWPETGSSDPFGIDVGQPNNSTAGMNYWDPAGNELHEFFRTGDPRWAWDFAIPAYWTQLHAAYLNTGFHFHGNRNGLAVQSGGPGCTIDGGTFEITQCTPDGTGGGQWHRSAFGSDDYTYAMAADLAYVLRPSRALRDRFAQAGQTVLERYDPSVPEVQREAFVNVINLTRQVVQHLEMLANCAEFVPGGQGAACDERLHAIVDELARDNLRAGILCQGVVDFGGGLNGDIPGPPALPPTQCHTPQQFMQNALMYGFLYRYWANYGDPPSGSVRRALVEAPATLYREGLPTFADGTLDTNGAWAAALDCQLSADGADVLSCQPSADSDGMTAMGSHTRPHTAAWLLIADELEPSLGLCSIVRAALDDPAFTADTNSGAGWGGVGHFVQAGWWKGTSQMMQSMVFAVGLYESCGSLP